MFKRKKRGMPELNTAALPDLIFTILFFFILVTHLRSVDVKLKYQLPEGQKLTKMQDRSSIIHVYVDAQGQVQIENSLVEMEKIPMVVNGYKERMPQESGSELQISFKADRSAKMAVITQVKTELRKCGSLKINYSATEKKEN
ncbi:MAG: biopolymer transporter ExbD [Bacteroidaceae bacterium]|nr:biopolymer transporter ExbD [Bacteroidaceae bacterium]